MTAPLIPIRPGTGDGALMMGMMRWMIENRRVTTTSPTRTSRRPRAAGEPSFNASWLLVSEPGHPREGCFVRGLDLGMAIAPGCATRTTTPIS